MRTPISIRKSTYREILGFTVTASRGPGFPPNRVFTPDREKAEAIRNAYREERDGGIDRQACQERIAKILLEKP